MLPAVTRTSLVVLVAVLVLLTLTATPAAAWWAKGHMAVAEVARRSLTPEVRAKVEACAAALHDLGPFPKSSTMVEMAPWADDLKSMGLTTMATWHFIDTPYNPDAVTLTINPVETVNVVTVIPMLVTAIASPTATSDSIVTSVANLIHYVGDLHMPLHSADLFSAEYPLGDYGGNTQVVIINASTGVTQKLHAFWDSMGEGPQADPARPLSASATADLRAFVDGLLASNTFTEAQRQETDTQVMADESFQLAMRHVYPGVRNGTVLSAAYVVQAQMLAAQRVTLAGHRLATLLNTALAQVSLDTLSNATKRIQAGVTVPHTGDTYNFYGTRGVEGGAAAGIFLSCFVIGCLLATAVAFAISCARDDRSKPAADGGKPAQKGYAKENAEPHNEMEAAV